VNVDITTEVTETTVIENDNAKVVVTNGKITLIKAYNLHHRCVGVRTLGRVRGVRAQLP
jgi:hypothetical protein